MRPGRKESNAALLAPEIDIDLDSDGSGSGVGVEPLAGTRLCSVDEVIELIGFGCVRACVDARSSSQARSLAHSRFQLQVMTVAGSSWLCDAMELMILSFLPAPLACTFHVTPFGQVRCRSSLCISFVRTLIAQCTHATRSLHLLLSRRSFPSPPPPPPPLQQAMLVTVVFGFMFLGSPVFGLVADRFGRRVAYILAMGTTLAFGIVSAFSTSMLMLYVTRGMCGFGIGGVHVAITLFSEFLPTASRARGLLLIELFWCAGTTFAALMALWLIPAYGSPFGWQALLGAAAAPIAFSFLLLPWLPESPRWLVRQGRMDKAMAVLQKAAHTNRVELGDIRLRAPPARGRSASSAGTSGGERPSKSVFASLKPLLHPKLRRGTLTIWLIWLLAAFLYYDVVLITTTLFAAEAEGLRCPTESDADMMMAAMMANDTTREMTMTAAPPNSNIVMTLGPEPGATPASQPLSTQATTMAQSMGLMPAPAPVSSVDENGYVKCVRLPPEDYVDVMLEAIAELPGILFTALIIDRLGRRGTQTLQYTVMGACMLLLLICVGRNLETATLALGRGMIVGAFQVIYVYTPEFYPTAMRATGLGIAASVSRLGAMIAPIVAQVVADVSISAALLTNAAACVVAAVACALLPYETAGRKMRETLDIPDLIDPNPRRQRSTFMRVVERIRSPGAARTDAPADVNGGANSNADDTPRSPTNTEAGGTVPLEESE